MSDKKFKETREDYPKHEEYPAHVDDAAAADARRGIVLIDEAEQYTLAITPQVDDPSTTAFTFRSVFLGWYSLVDLASGASFWHVVMFCSRSEPIHLVSQLDWHSCFLIQWEYSWQRFYLGGPWEAS